jgi:hypothetical protein
MGKLKKSIMNKILVDVPIVKAVSCSTDKIYVGFNKNMLDI